MAWRYLARRLRGDGTEEPLIGNVPLHGATLREDLSGPGEIRGTIEPEIAHLQTSEGAPIFQPWSTAIYAEKDGRLRAGGILTGFKEKGPNLSLSCVGFSGYLQGQPYDGSRSEVDVDPMDMARHLWEHKQAKKNGNLGLVLDGTKSPVRIGSPLERVEFVTEAGEEVSFEAGPYTLQWWKTFDMGREFDDLAASTPFDYRVSHEWEGENIAHRLHLGYPKLGRRRHDLRFMVGENVFTTPEINYDGDDFASEVVVLGAGEGRKMIRGTAPRVTNRLHRAVVVQDKSLTSSKAAEALAARELSERLGDADVSQIVVPDHDHARIGEYDVGDEILLQSRQGWTDRLDLWVRILAITTTPERNHNTLSVARVEKAT